MAIIYTYPDLGAVDGTEKLLVSDGSDENNTKTVTTAAYGAYINATYGGGGGSSIYQADGSITANRQLSGSSLYSLTLTSLTSFLISTVASGDIGLNPSGNVVVGDSAHVIFTDEHGIKNRSDLLNNFISWDVTSDLTIKANRLVQLISNTSGVYIANAAGSFLQINNGVPKLSGTGNAISDITDAKHLTTKEWVEDYIGDWVGSTNITTLGTITTGTWNGTGVGLTYGGTGLTSSYTQGDILYYNTATPTALTQLGIGATGEVLMVSGGLPSWQALTVNNSNWSGTALSAANGGTGQAGGYTVGDILYADSATTLSKLPVGSTVGHVLTSNGVGFAPSYQAAGGGNLYTNDGVVLSGRTATITDTLSWGGGSVRRNVNSIKVIEVAQESDFGTVSAGNINLAGNTTYIVRGSVTCSNTLTANSDGTAIVGLNRNLDKLTYSGSGNFITVTDVDFTLQNIWLSATTLGSLLIRGSNVAASGLNNGRDKVLEIVNCQIRNCSNVMDIDGFDLVDISNTLFFYVARSTIGCRFRDVSKLEISSCELIRWYDEANNSLPSWDIATSYVIGDKVEYNSSFYIALTNNTGSQPNLNPTDWSATEYSTASMIELQNNNLTSFGAVNINGCIIHPQQTQNGINIGTGSTTGFGTISSNAFVSNGLTTGEVFLPVATGLPDYSQAATYNYDVFANQGVLNSTSGVNMTFTGNATPTALGGSGTPAVMNSGGSATAQAAVRYTVTGAGRCTYNGTKQVYVSIHAALSYEKQGGGVDPYSFFFYKNGVVLTDSVSEVNADDEASSALSMVYGVIMEQNDYIEIYIQRDSGGSDDMLVKDLQLVIRE